MNINRVIYIIIAFIVFTSCKKGNLDSLEELLEINLSNKVTFYNRTEEWDGFQGNGFFIETYSIKEEFIIEIEQLIKKENFVPLGDKTGEYLDSPDIKESIKKQKGYYKIYKSDGNVKIIIFNNIKKQLIYYYILY